MYFKYHVNNNELMSTETITVFDAVKELVESKKLDDSEVKEYFECLEVLEDKLPNPSLDDLEEANDAQLWFKDNEHSETLLETVEFYVKVLRKYNSSIVLTRCNTPGKIIYEDDFQVGVISDY